MNQPPSPDSNPNQSSFHQNLEQNIEGSPVKGGVQGVNGDCNTQIQGYVNQFFFNELNIAAIVAKRSAGLVQEENHARQILLNRVKQIWVKEALESKLRKTPYLRTPVELDIEEWPDAVEQPFKGQVWSFPNQRHKLPPGTKVIDKFDEIGAGRTLLILGKPGSGKTTTLLRLAANLIARVEKNKEISQLIPVVFQLSDWGTSKKKTIGEWLVQELNEKYYVRKKFCETWVKDEQLLLLLDGLDQVRSERRDSCIQALRQFRWSYGQTEIVVCSRIEDYKVLSQYLNFQNAICLQSLTIEQINYYTANGDSKLADLNRLLQTDLTLQELAKNPLMLSVMTLVPKELIKNLPKTASNEEYYEHLFNVYIEHVLEERRCISYSKEQVKGWLSWLAWQMSKQSQTIFLIEWMQPNLLLDGWQKWIYYVGVILVTEFIFLLITLIPNAVEPKSDILVDGLLAGLLVGLMRVLSKRIELTETLEFSWKKLYDTFSRELLPPLKVLLIVGLIVIPVSGFIATIKTEEIATSIFTSASALILYLSLVLVIGNLGLFYLLPLALRGEKEIPARKRKFPNIGLWWSVRNTLLFMLVGTSIFIPIFMLICWKLNRPITNGIITGIVLGIGVGIFPGLAHVQHLVLRSILCFINRSIPLKYACFLDYAASRNLLLKVGGGTCSSILCYKSILPTK